MEYVYLSAIIGLCFFNIWSYRRGLKDGMWISKGKDVEPIKNPVQAIVEQLDNRKQAKVEKAAEDELAQSVANLFAYDGSQQKPLKKVGET